MKRRPRFSRRTRWGQILSNRFNRSRNLGYKPIAEDGLEGPTTRRRWKQDRYNLGLGPGNVDGQASTLTGELIRTLKSPRRRIRDFTAREHAERLRVAGLRQRARRKRVRELKQRRRARGTSPGPPHWGGSTYAVVETEPIARRHNAPIVSRKRPANHPLSRSNPGSDHNEANRTANARDYGTWKPAPLSQAISRHYGSYGGVGTYRFIYIKRGGITYRIQTLANVQGHYDHQHTGARR